MRVIIDDKIPYIKEVLAALPVDAVYAPGAGFTSELVRDADALIVRTRTRCDRALLEGSRVQFIATATIGYDHIDTAYCREAGIAWTNAPGCNSGSVAQYLHSVLLLLEQERGCCLKELTLGIVGVGHVGSKVCRVAHELGMRVLLNDPPRQAAGQVGSHFPMNQEPAGGGEIPVGHFVPLEQLASEADILTFHVPLYREGPYKTFHLADESFFRSLQRCPVLINTSRGEVVDTNALLRALERRQVRDAVIDVWEHEPAISLDLLEKAYLATPHIAGYSADGKANATRMSLDALCRHFRLAGSYEVLPPAPPQACLSASSVAEVYLQMYDPRRDSEALKACPERFEQLRGNYPLRREKEAYSWQKNGEV